MIEWINYDMQNNVYVKNLYIFHITIQKNINKYNDFVIYNR